MLLTGDRQGQHFRNSILEQRGEGGEQLALDIIDSLSLKGGAETVPQGTHPGKLLTTLIVLALVLLLEKTAALRLAVTHKILQGTGNDHRVDHAVELAERTGLELEEKKHHNGELQAFVLAVDNIRKVFRLFIRHVLGTDERIQVGKVNDNPRSGSTITVGNVEGFQRREVCHNGLPLVDSKICLFVWLELDAELLKRLEVLL